MAMDSMPTSALYNVLMNKMGGVIDKMASKPAADKVCDIIDPFWIYRDIIMRLRDMKRSSEPSGTVYCRVGNSAPFPV